MFLLLSIASFYVFSVQLTTAQGGQTCNATSLCSSSYPCCSEYGFCGAEHFCLGGCNPLFSNTLESCRPEPLCKDQTYTFPDNSRILSNSTYFDGSASSYDWVVDKGNVINTNSSGGELALILSQDNGGTRISSTRYVHFGTISAKLKTGRWGGVVTAFITMSDIKDEIDWEFPGSATTEAQTNYFWQGVIPNPSNGATTKDLSDTYKNYHEYTIDWQQDALTFSIDGNVVRTVKASDAGKQYPFTPSRVQLSIWPAGINSSAPGTVQWSGGMINWNDPDYQEMGHFQAIIAQVSIKCADPKNAGANMTSYIYTTNDTNPQVDFSNKSTLVDGALRLSPVNGSALRRAIIVLACFLATAIVLWTGFYICTSSGLSFNGKRNAKHQYSSL